MFRGARDFSPSSPALIKARAFYPDKVYFRMKLNGKDIVKVYLQNHAKRADFIVHPRKRKSFFLPDDLFNICQFTFGLVTQSIIAPECFCSKKHYI